MELTLTGERVSAGCEQTGAGIDQSMSFWAEGCPYTSRSALYQALLQRPNYYETLPPCDPPPPDFDPQPGFYPEGNRTVPEGYRLIDESVVENIRTTTYPAYEGQNVVYTNLRELHGNCSGLSASYWWKADEYKGIVRIDRVERTYCKTCDQNDTTFPSLAQNQEIIDAWNETEDRSVQCIENDGTVQERLHTCQIEYRCVKTTDSCPIETDESVGSYVSPHNNTFHEEIEITGSDLTLHYSSADLNVNDTTIAHGWSLSNYARLEGNRLYSGSGILRIVDTSVKENNLTVVVMGGSELLFDSEGKLQSTRDLYTKEIRTTFGYDNAGKLVTVTDSYAQTTTITRDANCTVTAIVAPTGQETLLTVDDNGDLIEVQYEDTSTYTFEYNDHLMTAETDPEGNRFLHLFNSVGKITKVIDAEGGEWGFDAAISQGYTARIVQRPGNESILYKHRFLENNATLTTEKILPTGDTILYTHTIDDTNSTTTRCGMQTLNLYKKNDDGTLYKDPYTRRRVLESSTVTAPSALSKTTRYSKTYETQADGTLKLILQTVTTDQKTATFITNYRNRTRTYISPMGKIDRIRYDTTMKLPVSIEPYAMYGTKYTYDDKGRVTKRQIGNRKTTYSYDAHGNLATKTDALGRTTRYSYDVRNRLSAITYADGTTLHYGYDRNGNLTLLQTPIPTDHTFEYNGVSKPIAYTTPLQKVTRYSYDKQRRLVKITKPSGKTIANTYTNGRLTTVTTPEDTLTYTYACQSLPSSISKAGETIHYSYDGTLLTSITQSGTLNQTIAYTYNSDFLPESISYADQTTHYGYNDDNELIQSEGYTITRTKREGIDITITDGNYTLYSHINRFGELNRAQDNTFAFKLKRNLNGQIIKKSETLQNRPKISYTYRYDKQGRLIEVKRNNKSVERYSYDGNGNREYAYIYGKHYKASYTLDDQLIVYANNTYRYDDDGYLIKKSTPKGTTTYSYNTMGALTDVNLPNGTQIHYITDPLNRRIAKEVNGTITQKYLWEDLTTLLAIYDKDDNLIWRFEYADGRMPLSMTDANGKRYYLHYDQVGSLRAVTDTDGNIVKEIIYDSYGNVLNDSAPSFKVPFGFAGGLYDPDTKLTHFGFREYDAFTGKWTAKDPLLFGGGDSNLYGYVLGDPVNLVDPWGLKVYLCKLPAKAAWGLVDHHWIKTDSLERGMWNARDTYFRDVPFLTKVAVRDEGYEPDAMCREIRNVDEEKVNEQLKLNRPLGIWTPWNQCQSFAREVLLNAGWDPGYGDNHTTNPSWTPWVPRSSIE